MKSIIVLYMKLKKNCYDIPLFMFIRRKNVASDILYLKNFRLNWLNMVSDRQKTIERRRLAMEPGGR